MPQCPARLSQAKAMQAPPAPAPWQRLALAWTHVVLEGFGLTGVFTRLSAVRCCTVQVPEHAVGSRGDDGFPTGPH